MRHYPLSPQLAAFVERTLSFTSPDNSPQGLRDSYSRMCRAFTPPRPEGLRVSELQLAGVPARAYCPARPMPAGGWPCLLYLHGGGWMVGDLDSHDFITAYLAAQLQVLVIAVDYRLAPEHPFPAAFDDCLAAWRALQAGASSFALDARRLLVIGDSAGGNLAAALCLALRDAGEQLPAAQVLLYPGLGGAADLPSRSQCADAPLLGSNDLDAYQALYLPGPERHSPYARPLLATDLRGLPAAFIALAQFDPLRDDGALYHQRLLAADGDSQLYPGLGLVHGCLRARGLAPEVDALYGALLDYLRTCLE
ncbi:alpha/beta hydrolase [Pseudomonas chlororaphis]|uniref:alpha/beta hydrolase n=1 Tax=Pseudomonas chlororaphis TaxID=587753 RepID=UPI000E0C9921|nr:alpha/beta hydrolase [Pseudomonas chlororaphis]AZD16238.1 Lipolytic enzyme [Pseudomonas chlororaphis]WDH44901.1 alpha/beta hydrolase [Pseudomonas chlororaphis]WDH56747.1 alpha/beta hydrolase [Pseudomonas chlororaphis]WQE16006.1 alpha/beta hydrolase [Pseudomonas chlororaphis]